jgi:hypothetical protein
MQSQQSRRTRERGVVGLEYGALIAIAALVVGMVVFAISPAGADVRTHVCKAVASVFQLEAGCGDDGSGDDEENAEEPPDDETFEPEKCKIHETGDEYSTVVKIGFIEIGENAGFVVTEYSDDTVTMMATNGAEIGATGGFGADAAWGELEAGAKVDFGAGVEFDYGSTWHFENADQAESFREQLDDYLYDQWAMTHPVCSPMGMCIPRPTKGTDPPPVPTTTFAGVKLTADVSSELGISATSGPGPTQASLTQQGIAAQIGASSNWTVTNDNGGTPDDPDDDRSTYVTAMSLNSEVTGQIGLATGGVGSMVGMSYAITKDSDGNIVEIQIVSTSEVTAQSGGTADGEVTQGDGPGQTGGGGSVNGGTTDGDVVVTETTLAIDPDDAASQQTVRDWMGGDGDYEWPGLISLNMVDPSTADPADPFAMLLHNHATSSTIAYDKVTDVAGFALNVKFGLAFGVDFSMENSDTTATEATYLGAPRPDGTRPVIDFSECVS